MTFFADCGNEDLRNIAAAIRSGRLTAPFRSMALKRIASGCETARMAEVLESLHAQEFTAGQIAVLIEALLADRGVRARSGDQFDLVTTGPQAGTTANRNTGVVVRELFAGAEESVLVAGYAVYRGQRVFRALADRMQVKRSLKVQMFLDIRRDPGDTSMATEVVHRFGVHFRQRDWPLDRPVPELFYLPASLEDRPSDRAAMHAKVIVVDSARTFLGSANFTEAAHERNVEVGLLIRSAELADQLIRYFTTLIAEGHAGRVFPDVRPAR